MNATITQLQDIFRENRSLLADWLDADTLRALAERLEAHQPPVAMVYGFYNAGKSTLINALLGDERAPTGDVPTTAEAKEYTWRGWRLLDTPGIDAPIEHEAVASETLAQSDVVVFVVASDGALEDRRTWGELADIHRRGRGLVLVVNNKSGLAPEHPDFLRLAGVLRQRLYDALGDEAAMATPVVLVNAKTALKARLENKAALLEHSGLPSLERQLDEFMKRHARQAHWLARRQDLLDAIDQAIDRIVETMGDERGDRWRELERQVNEAREQKRMAFQELLDRLLIRMEARLLEQMERPESLEGLFETQVQKLSGEIGEFLRHTFAADGPWRDLAEQIREQVGIDLELDPSVNPLAPEPTELEPSRLDTVMEEKLDQLMRGGLQSVTPEALEQATEAILWQIKEWFPELLRGKGKVTLARWAGQVGRYAGPLVQVATAAWDIWQAQREEERAREAFLQRQAALRDAIHQAVQELGEKAAQQAEAFLNQAFQALQDQIAAQIRRHGERHGRLAECRQRLEAARRQTTEAVP